MVIECKWLSLVSVESTLEHDSEGAIIFLWLLVVLAQSHGFC